MLCINTLPSALLQHTNTTFSNTSRVSNGLAPKLYLVVAALFRYRYRLYATLVKYNDPISKLLDTQFDAVGQKCICFSRRICHRRKIVFVQKARSLFVLDSFTHHITCGLVPRGSILPFMDGKISNSFPTSFYCLALFNGNYRCLSHSQD